MNESLLDHLRNAREAKQNADVAMKALIDDVKKSDIYTSLLAAATLADGEIETVTQQINREALFDYEQDRNKHPHPKVELKTFKTFVVVDPALVRDWCLDNLRPALDANMKKVEKYVKEFGAVPGTETGEEIRVQIAREL